MLNPDTLARADEPGFLDVDLEAGVGRWYRVDQDGVAADGTVDLATVRREPAPLY